MPYSDPPLKRATERGGWQNFHMPKNIWTIHFVAALLIAAAPVGTAEAQSDIAKTFARNCKLCHGASGKPSKPFADKGVRNLSDPAWQDSKTDDQIRGVITEGVEDTLMQPFGKKLKPEQLDALVSFIRGLRRE